MPGAAWVTSGRQRGGRRVGHQDRPGAALRDRAVVPVRAQELLLPGHAEELPDQPVRRADRLRRLAGRRPAGRHDVPGAHRARPHGGGHRQVAARRRCHRTHPWRGLLARRLQPGRHTAHRDRHQAGDRHGGAGPGSGASLRGRAAGPAPRAGRLRRQDGAGLAAVRCQRLAAAPCRGGRGAGRGPARHPHRDQERQLAALGRARGPLRDAAAGRRAGPRGSRCCRRPATGTRTPA